MDNRASRWTSARRRSVTSLNKMATRCAPGSPTRKAWTSNQRPLSALAGFSKRMDSPVLATWPRRMPNQVLFVIGRKLAHPFALGFG